MLTHCVFVVFVPSPWQALRLTLVQLLMNSKGYNMNPLQSLYYVSPACLVSLLLPFGKCVWLLADARMTHVVAVHACAPADSRVNAVKWCAAVLKQHELAFLLSRLRTL